jgi:SAM-dependent methyltransferase
MVNGMVLDMPPNCVDHGMFSKDLPFEPDTFDLIIQFAINYEVQNMDWFHHLRHLKRLLKPDGVLELHEPVAFLHQTNEAYGLKLRSILTQSSLMLKTASPDMHNTVPPQMHLAGLGDVEAHLLAAPIGDHGGSLGSLLLAQYANRLIYSQSIVLRLNLMDESAYSKLVDDWQREERKGNAEMLFLVCVGRKKKKKKMFG